jgi:hypothetical protein
VRGIKAPSTLPLLSLLPISTCKTQNSFTPLFIPLGFGLVRFVGDLRRD